MPKNHLQHIDKTEPNYRNGTRTRPLSRTCPRGQTDRRTQGKGQEEEKGQKFLGNSEKKRQVREKRKQHLTESNSVRQWNRKRKELSELFCRPLLIPGNPALFSFPLAAPSNLSFSHRLSPFPPTHPQGRLSATAGGTPNPHTNRRSL